MWCLLSGHFTAFLLVLGALSCVISYGLYRRITRQHPYQAIRFHPLQQAGYLAWLSVEIIKANVAVIGAIINPGKAASELFNVDTDGLNEQGRVTYANSITLTPGTVSTDVGRNQIQVHALLASAKDGLMDNKMRTRVRQLTAPS